jgi:PAS domain S-box-containing protein
MGYKYLISLFGAILIFVSVGFVSYVSLDNDQTAGSKAALSYEILNILKELESDSKDISLSKQGFIRSGEGIFLAAFDNAKKDIRNKLSRLNELMLHENMQNPDIRIYSIMFSLKIVLAEFSFKEYNENNKNDSTRKMLPKNNIMLNSVIDLLSGKIEKNQRAFLQKEIENELTAEELTRRYIVIGNSIAFVIILASFLIARKKNLQKQKEAEFRLAREKDLKNKQIELKSLMNILPVGVFYIDNSQLCTYVNDSWCKISGFTADEVYGTDLVNILHEDDRHRTFESFSKAIVEGKNFIDEYRYICKNGEIKFVLGQVSPKIDSDGRIIGYIGTVLDITKQHIYREDLIKYNTLFESIAEGIPDPIFVKDINGRYEFINSAGAEMIGKNNDEIIGKKDFDLFTSEAAMENLERDNIVFSGKGNLNYEFTSVLPDGSIKTFLSTRGLVQNSEMEPTGLFGILRDITTIKEKENRIKKSLVEKETLLRETHHRVKNNLQIVASLLNMQSGYIKDTESKHYFQDSQNRIRTIAMLHEKLYGSEKFTHVNLKKYIEQLLEILVTSFAVDRNIIKISVNVEEIDIETEYSVPIGLVINEIVTNSFKYAFPKGTGGEIFLNISKNNGSLNMEIGDNGIGLNEGLDISKLESLGLQLIFTLIEGQLAGKVSFIPKPRGLVFGISIPMKIASFKQS